MKEHQKLINEMTTAMLSLRARIERIDNEMQVLNAELSQEAERRRAIWKPGVFVPSN